MELAISLRSRVMRNSTRVGLIVENLSVGYVLRPLRPTLSMCAIYPLGKVYDFD